jgi:hypothetical protein
VPADQELVRLRNSLKHVPPARRGSMISGIKDAHGYI